MNVAIIGIRIAAVVAAAELLKAIDQPVDMSNEAYAQHLEAALAEIGRIAAPQGEAK